MSQSTTSHIRRWYATPPVELNPDRRVLMAAATLAVVCDLAFRSGLSTLSGAALLLAAAAMLLASGRIANPQAVGMAAASGVFALWLPVRTSLWLIPLDLFAAFGLLTAATSYARGGNVLSLTMPGLCTRGLHALSHGLHGPLFGISTVQALPGGGVVGKSTAIPLVRGVFLATPLVLVLTALLTSADAVFRSFFNFDLLQVIIHLDFLGIGAWCALGLLRGASSAPGTPLPPARRPLGELECMVILGALDLLFAAFAFAQVVGASQGGRRVINTSGLTYAEHARSGFFQLLAVATITLATLLVVRSIINLENPRSRHRFVVMSETAIVLTLVIVVMAFRRLDLYTDAYGLTMLRLYVEVFILWIGVVFVFLGCALAGFWKTHDWLVPAILTSALLVLFALNVMNPEARVVQHNVARAERGLQFDLAHLLDLSDDAIPALVKSLPRLPEADQVIVRERLGCGRDSPRQTGWASFNQSRHNASLARARVCSTLGKPAESARL